MAAVLELNEDGRVVEELVWCRDAAGRRLACCGLRRKPKNLRPPPGPRTGPSVLCLHTAVSVYTDLNDTGKTYSQTSRYSSNFFTRKQRGLLAISGGRSVTVHGIVRGRADHRCPRHVVKQPLRKKEFATGRWQS
ncbi:hypothetical protein LSH36_476g02035 [Paralvinella palmiformis]|uniref:Uncharacterized protein n=1 Tax=Paralvinella palmiformis TaxID=53620 RepID=A0AAD9MZN2_9ANNE|nr:hypothetical protein LSH36_476g02035 [Paralvinella palmiformis]